MKFMNLFDRKVIKVSNPEQVFKPLDYDPTRRDFIGYRVTVEYKKHKTVRFFALKKAKERLQDGMARHREAEKRAWAYAKRQHAKM